MDQNARVRHRPYDHWMTTLLGAILPLAHAGESHWYDAIMFVSPMVIIVAVLVWTARRERKEDAAGEDLEHDAPLPGEAEFADGTPPPPRTAAD